jgi:hypothetical protein
MSEAPRWGGGGLCSNRLGEFSMTGTADALNRPEFNRGSWGPGQSRRAFHLTAKDRSGSAAVGKRAPTRSRCLSAGSRVRTPHPYQGTVDTRYRSCHLATHRLPETDTMEL